MQQERASLMNPVEDGVRRALVRGGIARGSTLLVAVSGGADSTALLCALARVSGAHALSLAACHVDHGIRAREENDADTQFVSGFCAGLGITLIVKSVARGECAALSRERSQGLEETARDMRHALLLEAAQEAGACAIALGHTRDDAVETLLMRVLQGSDVEGLKGIPFRRGMFIRPLLDCSRAQIIAYLGDQGQEWREDPSNLDTGFYRNRVRHVLLPLLEKEFPGSATGVLSLSRKLSLASDVIEREASRLPWRSEDQGFSIEADAFCAAAPAVRVRSLLDLYDRFRRPESPRRLPWRFLDPVLTLRCIPSNGTVLIGHGTTLFFRNERLFWMPRIASRGKMGYFIEVSRAERTVVRNGDFRLVFNRIRGAGDAAMGGVFILAREIEPPLVLRSKRKGDRILLEGGETPITELLTEWKVPEPQRNGIPILADRHGVLAVLGGMLGYCTRARAGALAECSGDADRLYIYRETDQGRGP
jgi:tRNA(Ile)-lysidine synthetase-like protein